MTRLVGLFLFFACAAAQAAEPIPDKTVVLTFDDAVKSHIDVVGPMLKEYGFGATFFVTHASMNDTEYFMSWEDVGELHRMGFEIGNHTWTHAGFSTPNPAARLAGELALVENELEKVGVPKPISFAWTGNAFGPEGVAVLNANGYLLARRGMQPELPYGVNIPGPMFDPTRHHQLLIPTAGDGYPSWTLDHFKEVVDRARDGHIAVVQFHGVPDVKHPWVHTPVEQFRKYMDYLRDGGFRVIALRDVLPYLPDEPPESDPILRTRYPTRSENGHYWPTEVRQTRERLGNWLFNMIQDHGYSAEEVAQVTALPMSEIEPYFAPVAVAGVPDDRVKVLPYPGGRHPRIGFLDGAIDPLRGTKVSIFTPWDRKAYVVLDMPEAIFSNLGLTFLAHTHIPTIWNDANTVIENVDWRSSRRGALQSTWTLPNGIRFGMHVTPQREHVDLELWLENGSATDLTELRTQICLMLKGAPGFNEQNGDRKRLEMPVAAVKHKDHDRWILIAFEHCGRTWGNTACPCIHSDPVLPDAAVGQRVSLKGRVAFHEGPGIDDAIARLAEEMQSKHE